MTNPIITIILTLITFWILGAIVVPLLTIPNFTKFKGKIQRTKKVKLIANKLKAKSKEQTLRNIFKYVTKKYLSEEEQVKLIIVPKWFYNNPEELLKKSQFLPCCVQNLIVRTLLVNTRQFKNSDIKSIAMITKKLTAHQYLTVKIDKQKYKVDPYFKILKKI